MKTKLFRLLFDHGYITTAEEIGLDPETDIHLPAVVNLLPDFDLTIWAWKDGDNSGFLRDDSAGFSIVCIESSLEDQMMLAAWNADFDIRQLKLWLSDYELNLALKNAEKNMWGFDGGENLWGEEGKMESKKYYATGNMGNGTHVLGFNSKKDRDDFVAWDKTADQRRAIKRKDARRHYKTAIFYHSGGPSEIKEL